MSSVNSVSDRVRAGGPASSSGPRARTRQGSESGLPRVVLAGRPNAGKSTLFNRLLRRRKAVVDPTPGVTRDANEAVATWDGRSVVLVDTGGFETERGAGLERVVAERSLIEARSADLVVYVLDGKAGFSPADEAAARELRRLGASVLFVVNKIDSPARERQAGEFHRLGADTLWMISAEHGHGVSDLIEAILTRVARAEATATPTGIRLCVIGRPNVGKSSLVNRLLGFPRALVDATAGTTRDVLDTPLEVDGEHYVLVDTAGIRRRARIDARLERVATEKAMQALARSDVAVLVVDAGEGITAQDQRLAGLAWNEGRGLVVVANKWDLRRERAEDFVAELRRQLPALATVPVLTVSALTGTGVGRLFPTVRRVATAHAAELRTARLNEVVAEAVRASEPPLVGGRRPRIFYATQTGRRPPTITLFASVPGSIPASYQRYLQNRIAEAFRLTGTPIRIRFRARH